jgi:hypothetical protein
MVRATISHASRMVSDSLSIGIVLPLQLLAVLGQKLIGVRSRPVQDEILILLNRAGLDLDDRRNLGMDAEVGCHSIAVLTATGETRSQYSQSESCGS